MPEIQPPAFVQEGCHTAQGMRLMWDSIICEPGMQPYTLQPMAGEGMQVVVSPGQGWVRGDQVGDQGMYHIVSDSEVAVDIAAADPTDDRIDVIVARVYDEQYSGTSSEWRIEVVEGSASPSPVPPDLPPNSILLGLVEVPAGAVTPTIDNSTRQGYKICNTDPDPIGRWTRADFTTISGTLHNPGGWALDYSYGGIEYAENNSWSVPEPGWYEVFARCQFNSNPSGIRDLWICGTPMLTTWPVSGGIARLSASRLVRVNESEDMTLDDVVQLRQTSGGDLIVSGLEVMIKRAVSGW